MPKILLAILSGWNGCSASIFSPTPINLMGLPLIFLIDKAAPPLESPSNLVSIAPVIPTFSWNDFVKSAASWPIIESTTSKTSSGLEISFIRTISLIIESSICNLPAVSIIIELKSFSLAKFNASLVISSGLLFLSFAEKTSNSYWLPNVLSCSTAAGR